MNCHGSSGSHEFEGNEIGELTNLNSQQPSESLRTTVSFSIAKQFGLTEYEIRMDFKGRRRRTHYPN
jgi:hypothetical protein